jgi:hypothetical protein
VWLGRMWGAAHRLGLEDVYLVHGIYTDPEQTPTYGGEKNGST